MLLLIQRNWDLFDTRITPTRVWTEVGCALALILATCLALAAIRVPGSVITMVMAIPALVATFQSARLVLNLREHEAALGAFRNLTAEREIGFATVVDQGKNQHSGQQRTRIRFSETNGDDPPKILAEKVYDLTGDVVYFDGIVITFDYSSVAQGNEKALFLWRRIYDQHTAPEQGFALDLPGTVPKRYATLLQCLKPQTQDEFWSRIWDLAYKPRSLEKAGISAIPAKSIDGHAVYTQVKSGFHYVIKFGAAGQLWIEKQPVRG